MQEEHQVRGVLRFGVFELNLRAGELRKHGLRIRLQEQPFQALATLLERQLEHPGEVVTREDLQKRLWPDGTFVDFEHGLNKVISKVREALGDSAENPRFIETVARRGYRFIADVKAVQSQVFRSSEVAGKPAEPRHHWRTFAWRPSRLKVSAIVLIVLATFVAAWRLHPQNHPSTVIRSLAVLPIESLSGDASQTYFADGMTDELISDLGQISSLRVISRTTAMLYKHAHKPLPQIARELNVDAVVEGTVLRSGDRVRITAQLIEASTDKHLWSESYESELRDTLALQNKVARAIAEQIRVNLNPREPASIPRVTRIVNTAAYESYLKGRYFWNKRTKDGLKVALAYFNQAVDEDPKYAEAYAGLADTYALLGDWQYAVMPAKEALPRAKAAAIKALELESTLSQAHNSLAFCLDGFDWDLESAGKEFRTAIALDPNSATAHHWYAWHLSLLRRYEEAVAEMKKAQNLDPLSLIINSDLAELLIISHAYDESIRVSRKTLEMDPNFGLAHNQLGLAYLQRGMNGDAVAELQKAVELSGGSAACKANLARGYIACGKRAEAEKLLSDLKARARPGFSNASEIAAIYTSLGDHTEAMRWLEKGYQERFNPGVLLRPGFDPLRSDPRFVEIVSRIGLPR